MFHTEIALCQMTETIICSCREQKCNSHVDYKPIPSKESVLLIIYSGATILGGETVIGARSIVGGNVWLTESVPPDMQVLMERPNLIYKNGVAEEQE